MKQDIGNRPHLETVIAELDNYSVSTRKFGDVLSGRKAKALLGYPNRETASALGVSSKAKIILKRGYALHMDNSGHFTGSGFGKNGHYDPNPLTIRQVSMIPKLIKTAKQPEIFVDKKVRGLQRYKILRKPVRDPLIVVEVSTSRNEIYLVTAYNKKTIHPQSGASIKSRIECSSPQSHVRNERLT